MGIGGGDAGLVAALGGIGTAAILQTATVFGFNLPLNNLASDGQVFNSNFTVSMSGLLTPIGILGFARRARR